MENTRKFQLSGDGYQHRMHNKNLLLVHLIFVTKYRKNILHGAIRADIKKHICDACRTNHWYVKRMETDGDHIHMLLQYNPADSVTRIVSLLKQKSTYYIWKTHNSFLQNIYWKEHTFWSDGYFACSIGMVSKDTIERYIENQG